MYTSFFGLNEKPFAITPDPRYLYMSERHSEALAHLMYGVSEAGGFVQLTGEVGTGKTTVVRSLLGQIPQDADIALILNPRLTPAEFLLTICEELHVPVPEQHRNSTKALVDALSGHLLAAHAKGRRVVVIADEAQNLSFELLEQVRLLTNLETPTQKLLQIILIGQPELRDVLQRVELRQLAQRITGRYHLKPLSRTDTGAYVRHRLRVAGATAELFTPGALREIHRLARGIPRVINVLCDRSLLGAYTQERHTINGATVRRAAREIYGRPVMPLWTRWAVSATALGSLALFALGAWRLNGAAVSRVVPQVAATLPAIPAAVPPAAVPASGAATGVTAPAQPRLAQLLQPAAAGTDAPSGMEAAFADLFALWGADYGGGEADPCVLAPSQGLECASQRGAWGHLQALNRPAILILTDDSGAEHYLTLMALDDEQATVSYQGQRHQISILELSRHWFGDFLLLWRPRVQGAPPLSVGMQGEAVRWLRRSLERAQGLQPAPRDDTDVYDWKLVALVEDFQRDHRLTVDGIAGKQTQLVLDSALAAPDTPLLTASAAQGG